MEIVKDIENNVHVLTPILQKVPMIIISSKRIWIWFAKAADLEKYNIAKLYYFQGSNR